MWTEYENTTKTLKILFCVAVSKIYKVYLPIILFLCYLELECVHIPHVLDNIIHY